MSEKVLTILYDPDLHRIRFDVGEMATVEILGLLEYARQYYHTYLHDAWMDIQSERRAQKRQAKRIKKESMTADTAQDAAKANSGI